MNQAKSHTEWPTLIREYIDSTGDSPKQQQFHQLLMANFYKSHLMLAKTDKEDEKKAFAKEFSKATKAKVTASQCETLAAMYNSFNEQGWMKGDSIRLQKLKKKSNFYNIWICKVLMEGKGVHPATHIAKLTHSSSGASSIFDRVMDYDECYLTTSSLKSPVCDGAYPNGALSKNVKFLLLDNQGILSEEIYNGNIEPLSSFADDEQELVDWMAGFDAVLRAPLKTDSLAKQVYFPVDDDYHLLTPLTSSSLCQALYERCFSKDVWENAKVDREILSKATYKQDIISRTINTAKITVANTQPQNVSVLCSDRAEIVIRSGRPQRVGRNFLFSTQPPQWQTQLKAPTHQASLFNNFYLSGSSRTNIQFIRDFLLRFKSLELSIKEPKRKKWLESWVQSIFDDVLCHISSIHSLSSGWSIESKLNREYQYLLDPFRDNPEFQSKRKTEDWQPLICSDFARWLNRLLVGKDKKFTPQALHRKLWHTFVEQQLREFDQLLQMEQKHKGAE